MMKINIKKVNFFRLIVAIAVSFYIVALVYTMSQNHVVDIYEVNYGEIEKYSTLEGLLIQSEYVVRNNVDSNAIFQKNEGDRVAKDSVIAVVQDTAVVTDLNKKIAEIDEKIKDAVMSQDESIISTIYNSDVQKLDEEIQQKAYDMSSLIRDNEYSDIIKYKESIDDALRKKMEILGLSGPSATYISSLLQEREGYKERLSKTQNNIVVDKSGLLSYNIDGFENVITSSIIDTINSDSLENLILEVKKSNKKANTGIKVIDNFEYYIAFKVEDNEFIENIKNSGQIWIRINQQTDLISASIYDIRSDDSGTVLVLKVINGFENNINQRVITADIVWEKSSGLMVPVSSLVEVDGKEGVVAVVSNYFKFKEAKIINRDEKYAIVEESSYLMHEYYKETEVVLYDQIMKKGSVKRIGGLYKG